VSIEMAKLCNISFIDVSLVCSLTGGYRDIVPHIG